MGDCSVEITETNLQKFFLIITSRKFGEKPQMFQKFCQAYMY